MSDYLKRKKIELLQSLSKREVNKLLKNNSNLDTDILQAIQYHHLADIKTKPKEEPKPVPKPKEEPKPVPKPKEKPKPVPKPKEEPKPVPKEEPKPVPKPKEEPKPVPKEEEPKSVPKPKEKPKSVPKPKEEPKPVPKDDSKESTKNLLIEIGDKNNGIFVANFNDNLLIHMGDGNIEPHTVFINKNGDDNTKTHGNNESLLIEISNELISKNNQDSTIIIELYPQTTDDEDIGGIRVWVSGVLIASYQHDFTQNYIHQLNAIGGFKQINDTVVTNTKFENWNKDTPNNCLICYKQTGKFIDSSLIKTVLPKKKKSYKNFKGFGKDIITYLSENTDDEYKVTLTDNSPLFSSTKKHFESHTILLCFY